MKTFLEFVHRHAFIIFSFLRNNKITYDPSA